MKYPYTLHALTLLAVAFIFSLPAIAQTATQRGVARMITRSATDPVKPVVGARIVVDGAAQGSKAQGQFTLNIKKNKEGSYKLQSVTAPKNSNLILASPRLSDKQYLTAGNLVLAFTTKEDKVRVSKAQYDKLQEKYDKQSADLQLVRNKLRRQAASLDKSTQAYNDVKHQLDSVQSLLNQYFDEKQQENITKELQRIAEQLALTDYQSLDSLNRLQYELKAAGDWPSLSKLLLQRMNGDAGAWIQQQKKYLEEARDNKALTRKLDSLAAENLSHAERSYASAIEDIKDAIDAFKMQHLNDSVSHYYEILIAADSTNWENLNQAGWFEMRYLAHYNPAKKYFETALRHATTDTVMAICYNSLACIYFKQKDYSSAEKYLQKALDIWGSICRENNCNVAGIYNNLAQIHQSLKNFSLAEEYHKKALQINKTIFGEMNSHTASIYNDLGHLYLSQGHLDRAEYYQKKAIRIQIAVLGEESLEVATSYNNLGSIYESLGDSTRAEENYKKALEIKKTIFGEFHPDVASVYTNLACLYLDFGNYSYAIEGYRRALKIYGVLFGEQNLDVASSYYNIGHVYEVQRKFQRAIEFYNKALDIYIGIFGEQQANVVALYDNIGNVYLSLGDDTHAVEYYQKTYELAKSVLGESNPQTEFYRGKLDYLKSNLNKQQ